MRVFITLLVLMLCSCVERFIYINSKPDGATCYIDGKKVGRTPCKIKFIWYGKREIFLEREGYKSIRRIESINPPWYQIFPIDFITDVVIPFKIRDERRFFYRFKPQERLDPEGLKRRASEFKKRLE
jgi:hypothetical protein